jgi:hypothetical protein
MAQRSRNLMVLDEEYVLDAAGLLIFVYATSELSGLKCKVMFHHAEASTSGQSFWSLSFNGSMQS